MEEVPSWRTIFVLTLLRCLILVLAWSCARGSGAFGEAIDAGEEAVADFIPEGFDVIHALVGSRLPVGHT